MSEQGRQWRLMNGGDGCAGLERSFDFYEDGGLVMFLYCWEDGFGELA